MVVFDVLSDISCHMGLSHTSHRKEYCNCIFKSGTQDSDASVHTDYYTALLTEARDGHKVYWDS